MTRCSFRGGHKAKDQKAVIQPGSFGEACVEQNTVSELELALAAPMADIADCRAWGLTILEWRAQVELAFHVLRAKVGS